MQLHGRVSWSSPMGAAGATVDFLALFRSPCREVAWDVTQLETSKPGVQGSSKGNLSDSTRKLIASFAIASVNSRPVFEK